MLSQQRKTATHGGANAIDQARILDAAYDLMLAIGPKRVTMADIARKAGISRATLYRRWSNVGEVLSALLTRELDSAVSAAAFGGTGGSARARLVEGIVRIAAQVRTHPLLRKIIELDPEFLVPYLLERRGTSTDHQAGLIEAALRVDADDPSLREGDPRDLAEAVLLVTWSFVLTGPVLTGETDRLDGQLNDMLDRFLAP